MGPPREGGEHGERLRLAPGLPQPRTVQEHHGVRRDDEGLPVPGQVPGGFRLFAADGADDLALSGRTHAVCTGVAVARGDRLEVRSERTEVTFRPMAKGEIWSYIRTGDPMDKAGAYGVQGKAALFVSGIRGDYFNVMGLPLHLLGRMLGEFGVPPPRSAASPAARRPGTPWCPPR